jgi:hypothetical protein
VPRGELGQWQQRLRRRPRRQRQQPQRLRHRRARVRSRQPCRRRSLWGRRSACRRAEARDNIAAASACRRAETRDSGAGGGGGSVAAVSRSEFAIHTGIPWRDVLAGRGSAEAGSSGAECWSPGAVPRSDSDGGTLQSRLGGGLVPRLGRGCVRWRSCNAVSCNGWKEGEGRGSHLGLTRTNSTNSSTSTWRDRLQHTGRS